MSLRAGEFRADPEFTRAVEREAGCSVMACFQCGKCGAGCPVGQFMDHTPAQIIHAIRLGLKDYVLSSKTIWLCASCETCTTRCPQGIDIAKIMDACRTIALREKYKPALKSVPAFYKASRGTWKKFGRMYEAWMLASYKFRTGQFFKDLSLGMQLMKKGKLNLKPTFARAGETRQLLKRVKEVEKRRNEQIEKGQRGV